MTDLDRALIVLGTLLFGAVLAGLIAVAVYEELR
jgi:hypothetical protein